MIRQTYLSPTTKVRITIKNIKKEDRICMKSVPKEGDIVQGRFSNPSPFLVLTYQIIYQDPRSESTSGKLNVTQLSKSLNYYSLGNIAKSFNNNFIELSKLNLQVQVKIYSVQITGKCFYHL